MLQQELNIIQSIEDFEYNFHENERRLEYINSELNQYEVNKYNSWAENKTFSYNKSNDDYILKNDSLYSKNPYLISLIKEQFDAFQREEDIRYWR